ncbi:MAG: hypothetical protein RIB67_10360 [Miltoncostaeaceae bacterium]
MATLPHAQPGPPRLVEGARFVPVQALDGRPHVAVDCAGREGTVLALSHWPAAGTPPQLAADTSALIAVRYLQGDAAGPPVDTVTCDHYDEDGLMALWLLLDRPGADDPARALAVAAAEAGDFQTWTDPVAAKVAIAAMRMAERGHSPFPEVARILAGGRGRDPAGDLYLAVLPRVRRLLEDPGRHRLLWAPVWERVEADIALLDSGEATIEERPAADLAIVRAPRRLHEMAVHPRTAMMRVMHATPDGVMVVRHRYETWVDYVSRPLAPRVDLAGLLPLLRSRETAAGVWMADEMSAVRPNLYLRGPRGAPARSALDPAALADLLEEFLARRPR